MGALRRRTFITSTSINFRTHQFHLHHFHIHSNLKLKHLRTPSSSISLYSWGQSTPDSVSCHQLQIPRRSRLLRSVPAVLGAICRAVYQENGLVWGDALRMKQTQLVGTHNSYHVEAPDEENTFLRKPNLDVRDLLYAYQPLETQLLEQHVRSLLLWLMPRRKLRKAIDTASVFFGLYSRPRVDSICNKGHAYS